MTRIGALIKANANSITTVTQKQQGHMQLRTDLQSQIKTNELAKLIKQKTRNEIVIERERYSTYTSTILTQLSK